MKFLLGKGLKMHTFHFCSRFLFRDAGQSRQSAYKESSTNQHASTYEGFGPPRPISRELCPNRYLEQYNADAKTPIDLVFFEHANKHIARLCRILRVPGGHALLLGTNGSGKSTVPAMRARPYQLLFSAVARCRENHAERKNGSWDS